MKKSNLIITIAVVFVLAVSSVGAILAASGVFAAGTPSPVTNATGRITFDSPYGIRWNAGKSKGDGTSAVGVFEVFNTAGFSWIASDSYVNATGDVKGSSDTGFYQMTHTATYHVMQDIVYEDTPQLRIEFKTGAPDFGTASLKTGVIDGRGYTLYDFPVRGGSTLYTNIYGTIKNLAIDAKGLRIVTGIFGGLFGLNLSGRIESCQSRGTIIAPTIGGGNVGGIIGSISGGIVSGCTNYADIWHNSDVGWFRAGGIVGVVVDGQVLWCVNYGTIAAPRSGGIVGTAATEFTSTIVFGCMNFGEVGSTVAYHSAGIVAMQEGIDGNPPLIIEMCHNYGLVRSNAVGVGASSGILLAFGSLIGQATIIDCVNSGNLVGTVTFDIRN